jgi:hypothetical protein
MAFEVEDLDTTLADLRARGVTFERFEMSGFDVRGDTIAAPDNYPSKGSSELGTFFFDSEGNLIGIAQPVRAGATRGQHGPIVGAVWRAAAFPSETEVADRDVLDACFAG